MTTRPVSLALLIGVFTVTGCVASKYKKAAKGTPPPITLGLAATPAAGARETAAPLEAVVQSVIVYQGPGSWKRAAYWDEYVVFLANRGQVPATVELATLTDFQGVPTLPGTHPWELEKQSRSYESRFLAATGHVLKIGGGTLAATGAVFAVGTTMVGSLSGYVGAGLAIASVGIVLPAYTVGAIFANVHGKHRVEDEFSRRRLELPLTLAPGQIAQGSLFFRITPGPQRLTLRCQAGAETQDAVVDLSPLADLHLKSTPLIPGAALSAK